MNNIDELIDNAKHSISGLQESVLTIYGIYEYEKSMLWLIEEVGELASSIRKGHDKQLVASELGDVLIWVISLLNILNLDGADVVEKSFKKEVNRQIIKYGKLKEY